MTEWIGVDLDGTLAAYGGWVSPEHIGEPIPRMMNRVHEWLSEGKTVKIMTARVSHNDNPERDVSIIQDWLEKHGLPRLEVTCRKDFGMIELWDDRAIGIIHNTGIRADGRI